MLVLKSLEEEEAECRARCAGMKSGDIILHCHHEILCEILTDPVENRIDYILKSKTDNLALRLRLMGPPIVDATVKADAEWNKACAEVNKAYAEVNKARAEWNKAYAELNKARAEWNKAYAELNKARAEENKACAEVNKAYAERNKACAEVNKANAELSKAYEPHYSRLYLNSTWNGKTIFTGQFAR